MCKLKRKTDLANLRGSGKEASHHVLLPVFCSSSFGDERDSDISCTELSEQCLLGDSTETQICSAHDC